MVYEAKPARIIASGRFNSLSFNTDVIVKYIHITKIISIWQLRTVVPLAPLRHAGAERRNDAYLIFLI